MFAGAAGQLFQALSGREIADAPEGTSAVRALAFLAWTTDDDALRESALARLEEIAATLAAIQPDSPAAHSARIVGLLAAAQASGGPINPSVTESWEALQAAFNPATGVFDGTSTYTTDDVAWLIGGANFMLQAGPDALKAEAARTLVAFYEATLNQSGMQLSAPPGKDRAMAGPFEKDLPSVVYYHGRNTPPPPMAGGQFGRLPLPAAEVQLQNGAWAVTDTRVDSAGAMHLANELNWLGPHLGSIPFPPLRDAAASNPGGNAGAASTDITISARDIAFDTSALAAPAGQEVTLTFVNNDDAVPHNFHLSGSGGIDAKTDIFPGSDGRSRTLRFTLDRPGTYTFVCDVHRGQMSGTLTAG
jgi:plastocyanin